MADGYQELTIQSLQTVDGISNLCRMINELYNNMAGDGVSVRIFTGYGTPESVVTAGIGSVYLRKDGTTDTTLYRKESGTGSTGWVAVANFSVPVSIANGGTGQTTAQAAIDALLPAQGSASGKFLTSNGTNASWGSISLPTPLLYADSSKTHLIAWANTERNTTNQSYTKLKEIVSSGAGTIYVGWDMKNSAGAERTYGKIYINNSPIGTEKDVLGSTYAEVNDTITVAYGDLIQLYIKSSGGGSPTAYCRNFKIYSQMGTVNTD